MFEIGADTTFSYQCDPSLLFSCGNPVSYQGYDYETVQIGEQCWFAENLRSESYQNGDSIPSNLSNSDWEYTTSGASAIYGEGPLFCTENSPDGDACDEEWSFLAYGRLYNWFAVDDMRGLCPSGWHVPSDAEWITLELHLGMSEAEANDDGWRGTDQGLQLRTNFGWREESNGTNASGFSALPGGKRAVETGITYFDMAGGFGLWWSASSQGENQALMRMLGWQPLSSAEYVGRWDEDRRVGLSIRCIKDSE